MDHYFRTLINGGGPLCTIKRLKLKCAKLLSNLAFNFNLRRYTSATRLLRDKEAEQGRRRLPVIGICATLTNQAACIAAGMDAWQGRTLLHFLAHPETTQCIPRKVLTLS